MLNRSFASVAVWAFLCALLLSIEGARATGLLIPAYFPPDSKWTTMDNAAASGAQITAVMNPDSGPGTAAESSYTSAISSLESAGGTVIGYVPTEFTNNSISTVESEIDTYESFYPKIGGFFLDEMTDSSSSTDVNYYQTLYSFLKGQNASYYVVANPGTNVPSSYANLADTLVTFEGPDSSYPSNTVLSWTSSEPASKFANIVYETSNTTSMFAGLDQAVSQNVGYVYFTDNGASGNPYNALPSYFSTEVDALVPEPAGIAFCLGALALLKRPIRRASTMLSQFRRKQMRICIE